MARLTLHGGFPLWDVISYMILAVIYSCDSAEDTQAVKAVIQSVNPTFGTTGEIFQQLLDVLS